MIITSQTATAVRPQLSCLPQTRISEWGRLPDYLYDQHPFVLLAIDELLALATTLTPKEQKQFWALLTAFASRARKVGMCSLGLATDPTYRALGQGGLNYRSQCGRISFRMFQSAGSRAILDQNGAEQLEENQFLALLSEPGVRAGVAANPGDGQLARYLARQAAVVRLPPRWLPGGISSGPQTVAGSPAAAANSGDTRPPINRLPSVGHRGRANVPLPLTASNRADTGSAGGSTTGSSGSNTGSGTGSNGFVTGSSGSGTGSTTPEPVLSPVTPPATPSGTELPEPPPEPPVPSVSPVLSPVTEKKVVTSPRTTLSGPRTGSGAERELVLPIPPFDAGRPPTAAERRVMVQLHEDGLSRNAICHHVYGFKNGRVFAWVREAIDGTAA
jgi:hypothetical protein